MKFRKVLEADGYTDEYGHINRSFHDDGVHHLTHEVLTGSMGHKVDTTGQSIYSLRKGGFHDEIGTMHDHLTGLGWEHQSRMDKRENWPEQRSDSRVYMHPNHQRYLSVTQVHRTHDDYDDTPEGNPTTELWANFGGLRPRPDAR